MTDIPENVDLADVARHLIQLRSEFRTLRDDVGVMSAILRRVDNNQTAYRDEPRQLYELHRDLRARLETLENPE